MFSGDPPAARRLWMSRATPRASARSSGYSVAVGAGTVEGCEEASGTVVGTGTVRAPYEPSARPSCPIGTGFVTVAAVSRRAPGRPRPPRIPSRGRRGAEGPGGARAGGFPHPPRARGLKVIGFGAPQRARGKG